MEGQVGADLAAGAGDEDAHNGHDGIIILEKSSGARQAQDDIRNHNE
jgi:hypothetical protein